jgi:NAD(P)-dependent dehydrogenase (short-subunit alcohol dehydrogenase family)
MTLIGKRVVVIGGTSGIGFATAQLASAVGAQVVVVSSSSERVKEALERLPTTTEGRQLDVRDAGAVAGTFAELGAFDHLVYTAGEALLLKPLAALTTEEAREWFEIRYWGAFQAVQHAVPHLRPGGSIVLTSGGVATRPAPGTTIPASTTAAVEALTRALAVELAPLRVNAVRPGVVNTALWDGSVPEPAGFLASVGAGLPVGHVGAPVDLASAYVFLMENEFASGTVLEVDGGAALV